MITRFNIIFVLLAVWLSSCSVSRYLPPNESIYTGAEVKMVADSTIASKVSKTVKEEIEPIIRPKPNTVLLGFPYKVWLYYVLGEPKKEKSFRGWFRKRFGEPPVFASRRAVTTNSAIIGNYLNNEGYFRSSATGELTESKRKSKATYTVYLKPRYTINSVQFIKPDSNISVFSKRLGDVAPKTLLKVGNPYRLSVIEEERNRVERELKKQGFYYFRPDYLIVKADTNLNNHKVNLYVELKPNTTQLALKTYFIQNIYVISDNGSLKKDTVPSLVGRRSGVRIVDPSQAYKPRIFFDAIGFRRGAMYSSEVHDVSLSRLINLKNFKFVKNQFELVPRSDSAFLDVYYYLTPLKKKTLRAEISAVTKSNNLTGTQFNLTWLNRNLFRGAEQLRLNATAGLDVQLGGNRNANVRDFYRTSFEAELSFPRFVLPFYRVRPEKSQGLPKTTLTTGFERLTQQGLYTQTSIKFNWGYSWRKSTEFEHTLLPIALNIVQPTNINGEAFLNLITDPFAKPQDLLRYFRILENRLILGAQYNVTYTPTPRPLSKNNFVFTGGIDIAGNVAGLLAKGRDEVGMVFGIPYEQYARFDFEMRYYREVSKTMKWASRVLAGVGIPYGNSLSMPQFKQYFGGGTNGIRAFRARTLGPGSYQPDSVTASIFGNASFGDIRLEASTELRLRFSQYFEGAMFVDAGNIWMYRNFDDSFYLPEDNAVFTNQFYKQVAVGGGLGLRIVTPFVLLRLDLATPFRKPWLPENERWVFNQFDFGNKSWRKENLVFNIAVGYSF